MSDNGYGFTILVVLRCACSGSSNDYGVFIGKKGDI